jgi:hypothetical protein
MPRDDEEYAGSAGEEMAPETVALDATPPKPEGRIVSKRMIPANDADTEHVRKILRRMPFAGDMFAPYVRAVEAEPIPPVNSRGGRDVEGWTAVYEAIVQPSESTRGRDGQSTGGGEIGGQGRGRLDARRLRGADRRLA